MLLEQHINLIYIIVQYVSAYPVTGYANRPSVLGCSLSLLCIIQCDIYYSYVWLSYMSILGCAKLTHKFNGRKGTLFPNLLMRLPHREIQFGFSVAVINLVF